MVGIQSFLGKLAGRLSASPSLVVGTFITHCVAMEEKDGRSFTETKFWLTGLILKSQQFIKPTDVSDMVVLA